MTLPVSNCCYAAFMFHTLCGAPRANCGAVQIAAHRSPALSWPPISWPAVPAPAACARPAQIGNPAASRARRPRNGRPPWLPRRGPEGSGYAPAVRRGQRALAARGGSGRPGSARRLAGGQRRRLVAGLRSAARRNSRNKVGAAQPAFRMVFADMMLYVMANGPVLLRRDIAIMIPVGLPGPVRAGSQRYWRQPLWLT